MSTPNVSLGKTIMEKIFFWGSLLGIALCVTGWLSSRHADYSFVRRLLIPEYQTALDEYAYLKAHVGEKLDVEKSGMRSFARLFNESSDGRVPRSPQEDVILKIKDWDISAIRLVGHVPYALAADGAMYEQSKFQVWDKNGADARFTTYDLKEFIKKVYGGNILFQYSGWIFWTGIGVLCFLIITDRITYYI